VIISIVSHKGGVGKTTSAVHLAAYLSKKEPTLLIDGDANRSATGWSGRGEVPFKVVSERQAAKYAADYPQKVIDTAGHLSNAELRELADGCDLLVVAASPDPLSLDALLLSAEALQKIGSENYRILLTLCNPLSHAADEARAAISAAGMPIFRGQVRRYAAYQRAALEGVTVDKVNDPHAADAWADYQAIGKEILK
jgi:chromosome partitioning protein